MITAPATPTAAAATPDTMPDRWLTRGDIRSEFGIGIPTMTLLRWMKVARFPARPPQPDGALLWSEREVARWVQHPHERRRA